MQEFPLRSGIPFGLDGLREPLHASLDIDEAAALFDVSATDPLIYLAAVMAMILMTLVASALPARRAASVDPLNALRSN